MPSPYSQFFLNANSNIIQFETIQLSHPLFSQTYYIVRNAVAGVTATLEDATVHTFAYYPMAITPSGSYNDLDQSLQIAFGDLGQILPQELDRLNLAVSAIPGTYTKPTLKYRTFRSDDLSGPLFGPVVFLVNTVAFTKQGATLRCSARRLNLSATGEPYAMDRFPMLRGFQ